MSSYLIFFGSSDGFTYVPFDESGKVVNFERMFPDFDILETSSFVIDNVNNSPILAKYFCKIKGKNYSILKLYGYGQSAISSRVEGSNIGVAIFSDANIELDQTNIDLLKAFFDNFTSICLSNKKFKNKIFENEAELIYNAFMQKYGFGSIVQNDFINNFTFKSSTEGYQVPDFKKRFFDSIDQNIERSYFTTDQSHLERFYKRWQGSFKAFLYLNDQFVSLKELEDRERKKQELQRKQEAELKRTKNTDTAQGSNQFSPQVNDLSNRLEKATKAYQNLEKRYRRLVLYSIVLVIVLFTLNVLQFFNQSEVDVKTSIKPVELPKYHFNEFKELEKVYLDSLLTDTVKMEILNPLLKSDYLYLVNKSDTARLHQLVKDIKLFNAKPFAKIDTNLFKMD